MLNFQQVRCRDGKIEQAQDCAPGRCNCNRSKPFGQAAFCTTPSSPADPTRVSGPVCDETWEAAEDAYNAYQEAINSWCQKRTFVDGSKAHQAYKIGMETSRMVREVCPGNKGRELPFNPDDDQFEDFYQDLFGCHDSDDKLKHGDVTLAVPVNCETAAEVLDKASDTHEKIFNAWINHKSKANLKKVGNSYKKLIVLAAKVEEACPGLTVSPFPCSRDDETEASDHAQCGPNQHSTGDSCLQDSEGQTNCDNSCKKIVSLEPTIYAHMYETC